MTTKRCWQRVDGVILLDKPLGLSSNAALQSARRLFSAAKAGHTGTLDPLASGLLPLCFGEATKFSADLLDADKSYEAELLFGITTDTADAEGKILQQRPVEFTHEQLTRVLEQFKGLISQIPPMYSALKRDGKPLYELARQGIELERAARSVSIHSLELISTAENRCRLRVRCSKGTYIRTLAQDIGEQLACGAHLSALRRTAVGSLDVAQAISLEQLAALTEHERQARLQAPDSLLQSLPALYLDSVDGKRFSQGNRIPGQLQAGRYRVYQQNESSKPHLLGLGSVQHDGELQPKRLVRTDATAEI
ncbi:MAG: tRNA pseudouridine(55) synthase TruB [Pseudomonadota bacterium]